MLIYDSYASLPESIRKQIDDFVEPPDPEVWVKIPIHALGDRTFLNVYNSEGGDAAAASYFDDVQAFEREQAAAGPGPEELGPVLRFDRADLDCNRAGQISRAQHLRLWHRDELQMAGAGAFLIAGIAFNVALLAGWITVHGKGASLGVVLILIGILFGVNSWQLWLDLASAAVAIAEGALTTTTTSSRSGMNYFFVVGGKRFNVPKAAYEQVREGEWRKLYYLRRSGTLLSVEPSR